ncbi:cache domain-containing protein [Megalodesulfovibrio gigas]|uniref:histidine kinase n=1 Tax=Megalodesulfovibrio gigas (strain ATCC 19364 / DSM 1382 / NCIMB 9332 / VKM B-1759) TaxID=1121448 RepID=T2GB32_MEGG1|nr:cache domain-containing protein [Megalodesulfovibrio gigas]AGW13097.1 putative PAS/PAC sensor hybrid histidine kinase [Megalodesulfovibrio gigas DSM 1382 = ATCC 19364]
MAVFRRLSSTHLASLLGIAFVSMMTMAVFWVMDKYATFRSESDAMRQAYVAESRADIRAEVIRAVEYIQYSISTAESRLRKDIRTRTLEAVAIAEAICQEHHPHADPEEPGRLVREVLRQIRFNNGRGYYFATRLDGVEMLFADRPELEGKNLLHMQDDAGRMVIQDMIRLAREQGQGFYEYTWTKPGAQGSSHRKIAYIHYVPCLDWFIGTGEYLDDVHADIQEEALHRLASLRFDPGGYLFGSTTTGLPLFTNGQITRGGPAILDLQDPHGAFIIRDQIAAAANPEGGFTEYSWRKLTGQTPSPKVSYVRGVPEWGWIIGAGCYVDDVEYAIANKQQALLDTMRRGLLHVGLLLLAVLGLAALMARHLARGVRQHFEVFGAHFGQAAQVRLPLRESALVYAEFRTLAREVNAMMAREAQAEQALRESEDAFRRLFEGSSDAILLMKDNRFVECNQAALTMLGDVSRQAFLDSTLTDISPEQQPDGRRSAEAAAEHVAAASSKGSHRFDWLCRRADGSLFMVDVSLVPITLHGDSMLHVTWRDVTARILEHDQLEQAVADRTRELQDANARLLALDQLKSSFLSTASHELRTPLTSILGFAKLLRRDAARLGDTLAASQSQACGLANRMVDNAAIIISEGLRLTRLINDLLDLNRIESGRMEWHDRLVDVASLAREVLDFMRGQLDAHPGVALSAAIDDDVPSLWVDPDRIKQVILNLLTNAFKFAPQGLVELQLRSDGEGGVVLQVQDSGPGVPPEEQERIFEKYHQGQTAITDAKPQGAGLGLAICRQIVEHYGGRIWVESAPGRGAAFIVALPSQPAQ